MRREVVSNPVATVNTVAACVVVVGVVVVAVTPLLLLTDISLQFVSLRFRVKLR